MFEKESQIKEGENEMKEGPWSLTLENLERMVDNDIDKKDIPEIILDEPLSDDAGYSILSYKYAPGVVRKKENNYYAIYREKSGYTFVFFKLTDGKVKPIDNFEHYLSLDAPSIADFKDIKVGVSTEEDVQKIMGDSRSGYSSRYSYFMILNDSSSLEITLDFDTKIVTNIDHSKGIRVEIFDRAYEKDLCL